MINSYHNPVKTMIGRGAIKKLPELLGDRTAVLITTDGSVMRGVAQMLQNDLGDKLKRVTAKAIPNPTILSITDCYHDVKDISFDVIIVLGGGSALDTAKGVSALSGGSVSENWLSTHLREGEKKPDDFRAKPIIAIPTTSGTGSEVTMWATVWDEVSGAKYSLSDERLYPQWALLDSALTDTLPYKETLVSGLDALSHAMEAIWNNNANPVSDTFAEKAISISIALLEDDFREKHRDEAVRDGLQLASFLAGMAFSNTKTALAHSISYPLTGKLKIPHGLACSFTLPEVLKFNCSGNKERAALLVRALGCDSISVAAETLYRVFEATGLRGFLRENIDSIDSVTGLDAKYIDPSRAANNLAAATQDDAITILKESLSRLL